MRLRAAVVLLACASLAACDESKITLTGSQVYAGGLVYVVRVGCNGGNQFPFACTEPAAVSPGDTTMLFAAVADTGATPATGVRVRAQCAHQFALRNGPNTVQVIPLFASCPDSTLPVGLQGPSTTLSTVRLTWVVPSPLTAGAYSIRVLHLATPAVVLEVPVSVQ